MNEAQGMRDKSVHEIRVTNRKQMTVDGVKDVIGFDETEVHLLTALGDMTIEGSDLRVKVLDVERGVVSLEGRVDGIFYSDGASEEKRSFWSRFIK
ncbi:MAG: sporulation protein YabP [Clostridia bacterium]|nr:sporulation protein YabP [Clostridia bacterium]